MKILITGGSGMVGRNLAQLLTSNANYNILIPSSTDFNLLDATLVDSYLRKHMPDMIIHCAGRVGGIQANINEPFNFFYENLEMGKNLLLGAKKNGITQVLNLGSSCIYPPNMDGPITEENILTGGLEKTNEGYALAKISVIKLSEYINRQYSGYQYKTIIPCNLFGQYDNFDAVKSHLIPAAIRKIHLAKMNQSESVEIWGDGTARREFMYAEDLAQIISQCIEKFNEIPELMNVGTGEDYTINEYYQMAADVIGFEGGFNHLLDKPTGMKRKLLDVEIMKAYITVDTTDIREGILNTYQYFLNVYKENEDGA